MTAKEIALIAIFASIWIAFQIPKGNKIGKGSSKISDTLWRIRTKK